MAEVIHAPFRRAHLNEMAEDIHAAMAKYANRVSLAEAIGILEIVKQEVYQSAFDEENGNG